MQLPATATLTEASALARTAEQAVAASGTAGLSVDASALASFDSSVVAVLLHTRRLAQRAGCDFRVVGAPDKLAQLARLYGVDELLGLGASASASASPSPGTSAAPAGNA